jgi:hypothetical protein
VTDRPPPMKDAALIESLGRATSLQLYQLAAVIERLITDPRRIVAIRKDLHLGQVVRFYDARYDVVRCCRRPKTEPLLRVVPTEN